LLTSSESDLSCVSKVLVSYFGLPDISAWEYTLHAAEEHLKNSSSSSNNNNNNNKKTVFPPSD
jgi:hypothetical protein